MEEQFGDERVVPFSFSTDPEDVQIEQKSCWLTYTNETTHDIIRANLDRSPLYSGMIEGTGPRYCPSIEDKVVRFADKKRHQVFIEPEGLYTNEMYLGGMSSSMPEDVQYEMYHSVAGLEHAKIVRNAYAIEYDCINAKQLNPSLEFKNINGVKFVVKGYGAKTGIRGVKEMGTRPQMAILDDLVSNDDSRSPTVIQAIKDTVGQAIKYALHPKKSKTVWLGTPFNANDPLYEAMESGAWDVSVYPICEKFPCSREEFKGAWEDRFDYDYVEAMYEEALAQGMVNGFYQELMLQIMSDEDRLVNEGDIKWFTLSHLLDNRSNFNFYITTDFATSEKESADFSFISVWAVNNKGSYFWVDGICKRQTMDRNIDDLFTLANKYKVQSVGVEVSGQQGGFIPWIEKEMMTRNIFFLLASSSNESKAGIRPTGTKLERFNVVVPDFKLGRFHFPIEKKLTIPVKEMLLEISQAAIGGFKSKHDDALDTISMLSLMQIWLPSDESSWKRSGDNIWGLEVEESFSTLSNYIV